LVRPTGFALSTRREAFIMGSGGSFVAILLSVPLTAVAVVGMVGVPKLQEMLSSASSHGDEEFDEEAFTPRSRSKRSSSKSDRAHEDDAALWSDESNLADEFSGEPGSKSKTSRTRPSLARTSKSKLDDDAFGAELKEEEDFFSKPSGGRAGKTPRETESTEMFASEPFNPRSRVTQAEHSAPAAPATPAARPDGFASAIEKLRAMGVDRFHLEPGLGAGQYLFVCQVEAADAGTGTVTVHRFESEAADPAVAVGDVMKQFADWQAESSVTKTAGAEFRR